MAFPPICAWLTKIADANASDRDSNGLVYRRLAIQISISVGIGSFSMFIPDSLIRQCRGIWNEHEKFQFQHQAIGSQVKKVLK